MPKKTPQLLLVDTSRRFLDVMVDAGVVAVLTWGLADRFLQKPAWPARLGGFEPRMLPLDTALRPTPMWRAMIAAFTAN